ncbi:hypothetical protein LWT83_07725 [Enterobacter hormaechei]|uniref:hypothetical protein n=1 Tax=Enterobacter hormaechei TaxID=158836 RepID=UPI001E3C54A8|nr:hypothetical protein [Enterobacter hormaechei]MCC4567838.1 hypothetical protein [Enterobacter hormaechei subsp. hoffmannii]MCC4576054.1 hypothetical protein [Enterobacter hormaechei subsp. hoffmannii]MCC4580599.1 hypothetical protein [Enterobacter hormaechei subsp. hoffmannii]MCC4581474.1 hypothetical protein [Enterobacter hormaechei subsp. hoffmannii]MCE1614362.1 hypothetical protein [Enterobacter hormaechei]
MTGFFTQIEETEEIRQGDIIRKLNSKTGKVEKLGVVITADCDIAQRKASERYTWLEILPMAAYVEGPWAREQLRKLSEKRSRAVCEYLNAQIRKQNPELVALTHDSLVHWLQNKTAEEILASVVGQTPAADNKQLCELKGLGLTVCVDEKQSALTRLKEAWTFFNINESRQQEFVLNAFKDSGGFQDYFVLPELPQQAGIGFVVMLRSMGTILANELYFSEQNARIDDRPDAFHRLGRLNDSIRFSITQKLAFLFSRIGMPTTFESACETATELMVEELFKQKEMEARE